MRNPAGSISQLHVARDPRSVAPGAQVVTLVPSEAEPATRVRRSSVAGVARIAYGGASHDHLVRAEGPASHVANDSVQPAQDANQLAGEVLTLRIGKRGGWRLAAMAAVVAIAIFALGARVPLVVATIVAIFMGIVWAHGVGRSVRVGIGGVTALNLFGTSQRLHWSDVRTVSFPRGQIVVHGHSGSEVRVPATFDGHRAAIRLLRIRLPQAALNQSRIGLETHYLCQWDDCE